MNSFVPLRTSEIALGNSCQANGRNARRRGYTLVEMLIVVAIVGILAVAVIPLLGPNISSQLTAAAQAIQGDIYYAQQLAITNASSYRISFSTTDQTYVLTHRGSQSSLDQLPNSPFDNDKADTARHLHNVQDLLPMKTNLELVRVERQSTPPVAITYVEFDSSGVPNETDVVRIWLRSGNGDAQRYIYLDILPVTGLTELGDIEAR